MDIDAMHSLVVFLLFLELVLVLVTQFISTGLPINNPNVSEFQLAQTDITTKSLAITNTFNNIQSPSGVLDYVAYVVNLAFHFVLFVINILALLWAGISLIFFVAFTFIPSILSSGGLGVFGYMMGFITPLITILIAFYIFHSLIFKYFALGAGLLTRFI